MTLGYNTSVNYFTEALRFLTKTEGNRKLPYYDTADSANPTISIGLNLRAPANLKEILNILGVGNTGSQSDRDHDATYIVEIEAVIATPKGGTVRNGGAATGLVLTDTAALQSALNVTKCGDR